MFGATGNVLIMHGTLETSQQMQKDIGLSIYMEANIYTKAISFCHEKDKNTYKPH